MPKRTSAEIKFLIVYVLLSRVRKTDDLISVGLDHDIRVIIESGPPENLVGSFDQLFAEKAAQTFASCCEAREGLAGRVGRNNARAWQLCLYMFLRMASTNSNILVNAVHQHLGR